MIHIAGYKAKINYAKYLISTKLPFYFFEQNINPSTISNHTELIQWAKENHDNKIRNGSIDINEDLEIKKVKSKYLNYFKEKKLVFFIQLPTHIESPANFSLTGNLIETLQYMGIQTFSFRQFTDLKNLFTLHTPNFILAGGESMYQKDWLLNDLKVLRKKYSFTLGLTGIEGYGGFNIPIVERLSLAKKNGVDFCFALYDKQHITYSEHYNQYRNLNFPIFSLPLGANLLKFQPINLNTEKDLDYVFLGSRNDTEYLKYFSNIFQNFKGFIGGMGWRRFGWVDNSLHAWVYARAKVGLNIHGSRQRQSASDVTERTYILAAAGVPQITDNVPLLSSIFGPQEIFVAGSPKDYESLFKFVLNNPDLASNYADRAKKRVLANHTTFHRAENFINDITQKMELI